MKSYEKIGEKNGGLCREENDGNRCAVEEIAYSKCMGIQ